MYDMKNMYLITKMKPRLTHSFYIIFSSIALYNYRKILLKANQIP